MIQFKDQTTVVQEAGDQRLAAILSRQNDVERAASSLRDTANRLQYQVETVKATIKEAEQARDQRLAEKQQEEKALDDARAEVEGLMAKNTELTNRLDSLRKEFKDTFEKNVGMVASSAR
jgi:chromosome segregation ATPase